MLVMVGSVTTPRPEEIKKGSSEATGDIEAVFGKIVTETLSKAIFTLRESGQRLL